MSDRPSYINGCLLCFTEIRFKLTDIQVMIQYLNNKNEYVRYKLQTIGNNEESFLLSTQAIVRKCSEYWTVFQVIQLTIEIDIILMLLIDVKSKLDISVLS